MSARDRYIKNKAAAMFHGFYSGTFEGTWNGITYTAPDYDCALGYHEALCKYHYEQWQAAKQEDEALAHREESLLWWVVAKG